MASCDFIIHDALIVDGSGAPGRHGDLAVDRGRIVAVGDCGGWRAEQRFDARGRVLAPGFIDSHTHDDLAVLRQPELACKLSQGVTTVIAGNCGISLAPLAPAAELPPPFPLLGATGDFRYPTVAAYRAAFEATPCAANVALLAGHSSLRAGCMSGSLDKAANAAEREQMRAALRAALGDGCIGLSTGLDYPPAAAAPTDEVVELARTLAEFDGAVYATHMRDEGDEVVAAVRETLDIGRRARVPVVISHLKCAGPANHGRAGEILALLDAALAAGQSLAFDVYPYCASSTSLLPRFVRDAEAVLVAESTPHPECNGMLLERIAADWQCSPEAACERLYPAAAIYFQIDERDLERFMRHPAAMIGSDGIPSMQTPHPRLWGSFPRVLGHYARERRWFDLETAVHKMSASTAARFGLADRGALAVGRCADLVLFDADEVIDRASYAAPTEASAGIDAVWVNGELAWRDGAATGARAGRFLTH